MEENEEKDMVAVNGVTDECEMKTEKPKRKRRARIAKVKKERKPRVTRSIVTVECDGGALIPMSEAPEFTSVVSARAWAKTLAKNGLVNMDIKFVRVLGSFKATPQTVMKFEID